MHDPVTRPRVIPMREVPMTLLLVINLLLVAVVLTDYVVRQAVSYTHLTLPTKA